MVKALYNKNSGFHSSLPLGLQVAKRINQALLYIFFNQQVLSFPLKFSLCPVYLMFFLLQTGPLTLDCGLVLLTGFGKSGPVLLPGRETTCWTPHYTCVPSCPPLQSNICTSVHNHQMKSSRNAIKQLFSFGSLCCKRRLQFLPKRTHSCCGRLWCLGESPSLLYSLPNAVVPSSASLLLSHGSAASLFWEGLGCVCLRFGHVHTFEEKVLPFTHFH